MTPIQIVSIVLSLLAIGIGIYTFVLDGRTLRRLAEMERVMQRERLALLQKWPSP